MKTYEYEITCTRRYTTEAADLEAAAEHARNHNAALQGILLHVTQINPPLPPSDDGPVEFQPPPGKPPTGAPTGGTSNKGLEMLEVKAA